MTTVKNSVAYFLFFCTFLILLYSCAETINKHKPEPECNGRLFKGSSDCYCWTPGKAFETEDTFTVIPIPLEQCK